MWDPPPTAGVLISGLTYHLTVTNMNTGVVNINTTTADTSYPLGPLEFCVNYTGNVTVLHTSATVPVLTMARTPGGKYMLIIGVKLNLLAKILIMIIGDYILQNVNLVVVGQNNTSEVIFSLQLKVSLS